uniref:Uncharacterized protein n=2 Tax=Physcomitrium patens TaxID=3218 RepID=A0A2K1JYH7_PHYPA|nr:uncharacterized protein LOC112287971 isoform X1 [Physcomitrium patens]PNR46579.1 hypothetical protein PHYPA_013698 [Physcomitrium patens]|eukprot:XP_024387448.1 uncharacterized protein LOC112287971 isoform X1 [Physcomitrella patens]
MAGKVTFVNSLNESQSFKVNLFGTDKNRVRVSNVLAVFKSPTVIMGDGSILEADDSGLSMDYFSPGSVNFVTVIPAAYQEKMQEPLHPVNEQPQPIQNWVPTDGEVGTIVDWQHLPLKKPRVSSLPPVIVPDTGGLETVSRSLEIGAETLQQHNNEDQHPAEVGEMVALLEGPSEQGSGLSRDDSPLHEESEDDSEGNTPYLDQEKASRGHIKCIKCGHSKNPAAKLLCANCGAQLREQIRARVAQRWAMLREKARRDGRLGDKAWQRRKKGAFDKLTDLTMLDLENTYFALFMARRNREGDKFSFDGWYSEGAGREFVTTGDIEAIWKSFVKKHHRKDSMLQICHGVGDHEPQES